MPFRFGWMIAALLATATGMAQSTFQITSVSPGVVPAAASGANEILTGTLPDFTQGSYQVCFYAGTPNGAITPSSINSSITLPVPASTIQGIPVGQFTAANSFTVNALTYIVPTGSACDGTFDASLTNALTVPIVEPTLAAYAGPLTVPQANSAAALQPPPTSITLSGSNFAASTEVNFGTYGNTPVNRISANALTVSLPAAFLSSPVGTTLPVNVCNIAGTSSYCSVASPAISLTIVAATASAGTIAVTPTPATLGQKTTLAATFSKDPAATGQPGAPSGSVTFTVGGTAQTPIPLRLDRTAAFAAQAAVPLVLPSAATPVIVPASGTYLTSQTVTISDATPGTQIYYTVDGSQPTTASTPYAAPFLVASTTTIQAIAAAANFTNSAVASAALVIRQNPPAKLAFVNQPTNTGNTLAIKPPVSVELQDAGGQPVTNTSNPVTLAIAANPGNGTLSGTLTQVPVNGVATFADLSINNIADGYTLIATSPNLASATSTPFNITALPISLNVASTLIGIASTLNGTFTLSQPAPQGGLVVTLASSAPSFVTISPATVTIPAGQTVGSFTYTGVALGTSTLSVSAPRYLTASVDVTATDAQVSLSLIPPVAPAQSVSLALSLAKPAPPGGTTVTFTSSNPGIATVTSSVFVPAGLQTPTANPQVTGVTIGTTTIKASAPGYAPATRNVNVTVVAVFSPTTITQNLTTSSTTKLNISAPAQAGGLTFTFTSDDPTIATVPATLTVAQGATSVVVPVTGVANGSTIVRANSPGVTEATLTVNISSRITVGAPTTGANLLVANSAYFNSNPTSPLTVTIKVSDPTIATISTNSTTVGVQTLTYNNITSYIPNIYVQGHKPGTTTLTYSAPGYTDGTSTITVVPSGFAYFYYSGSFTTTTFSSRTGLTIGTALLDPQTLAISNQGYALNPGLGPVTVTLSSSDTAVGTVTPSVTFNPGDTAATVYFTPATAGTADLTIGAAPAGFTKPSNEQKITATVTAPAINVSASNTGVNLEIGSSSGFAATPPTAVTATLTISDPTIASISASSTAVGSGSLTFANVTSIPAYYIQGHKAGTTTLTVSAPGFATGTGTITIYPSGIAYYYYTGSFSTTTFSSPTGLTFETATLDPNTLAVINEGYQVSPGVAPISVTLTSSNPAVGTVPPTLVFNPGDSSLSVNFKPVSAGTTNLALGAAPTGYSKPSNLQQITATVTAPTISAYAATTGEKLQSAGGASFSTTPPAPETVTVSVADPTVALISASSTTVGSGSLVFPNVANSIPQFFLQGQKPGTTSITVTAAGYTSGTATVTVNPSGFAIYYYSQSFTTTTFSGATQVTIETATLDPSSLNVVNEGLALSPGVTPVNVSFTSSAPSIGTLTPTAFTFSPGDNQKSSTFQPIAAGFTNLNLGAAPAGFSKPANYQQITATVTAPAVSVSDVVTGVGLQTTTNVYLAQAPPNPVTVTVTVNGTSVATISTDPLVAGSKTLTFPNISNTNSVPTIYVQGQAIGTTTITASAPGYTNGNGNVTTYPSGFTFAYYNGNFSTTAASAPTSLAVQPAILNPGVLTIYTNSARVNPGGAISVPVTSSNTAVGTITTSPLVFNPGDSLQATTFKPIATGSSLLTVGVPAGFKTPSQNQQITATVQ